MNKLAFLLVLIMTTFAARSQEAILLTANGKTVKATLENNAATARLLEMLGRGPITLSMTDNGGFEKIGNLPERLPTSDVYQTAQAGDIMLYIGNVFCIFYGSNSWEYTKIGHIEGMSAAEVKTFLSGSPVTVAISAADVSGIDTVTAETADAKCVYDLTGNLVTNRPLASGLYIIDGKKMFVRK